MHMGVEFGDFAAEIGQQSRQQVGGRGVIEVDDDARSRLPQGLAIEGAQEPLTVEIVDARQFVDPAGRTTSINLCDNTFAMTLLSTA